MSFNKVLALVIDDSSDLDTVSRAAEIIRENRGKLLLTYVIQISRSLPIDAEIEKEIEDAEKILNNLEKASKLPRGDIETQLLQAREIGPAVIHESVVRDVDAIIIGTAYTNNLGTFLLPEHIPYILEHAPCDVILWRQRASITNNNDTDAAINEENDLQQ